MEYQILVRSITPMLQSTPYRILESTMNFADAADQSAKNTGAIV